MVSHWYPAGAVGKAPSATVQALPCCTVMGAEWPWFAVTLMTSLKVAAGLVQVTVKGIAPENAGAPAGEVTRFCTVSWPVGAERKYQLPSPLSRSNS